MFCFFGRRISARKTLTVVVVANRHLRVAGQSVAHSPNMLLDQVVRRSLRTAKSKHLGQRAELARQTDQVKPKKSHVERPVSKKVASTRPGKGARVEETCSETGLVEHSHRAVTADDLREFPFLSLGVSRQLSVRLNENFGIQKPVEIQSLAIKPILSSRNLVIHSETGSGKTLAYLLPVVQQAKHRCHTIVVVPTRELAYQIYIEARKLAHKKDLACYVSAKEHSLLIVSMLFLAHHVIGMGLLCWLLELMGMIQSHCHWGVRGYSPQFPNKVAFHPILLSSL